MRDAIDVLQSIYRRQGRVFSNGPSDLLDGSRHADGRGPQRQQPAENEAPSRHEKVDYCTSEQNNSFAAPSRHDRLRYVSQENLDHRENSLVVVVEEGKLDSTCVSDLESKIDKLDHCLHVLEEGLDHARSKCLSLKQTVQTHRIERLEDRSKSAYSMLEYDRKYHALRDELSSARREFKELRIRH